MDSNYIHLVGSAGAISINRREEDKAWVSPTSRHTNDVKSLISRMRWPEDTRSEMLNRSVAVIQLSP